VLAKLLTAWALRRGAGLLGVGGMATFDSHAVQILGALVTFGDLTYSFLGEIKEYRKAHKIGDSKNGIPKA
jgi:hypothetical protein